MVLHRNQCKDCCIKLIVGLEGGCISCKFRLTELLDIPCYKEQTYDFRISTSVLLCQFFNANIFYEWIEGTCVLSMVSKGACHMMCIHG